MKTIPLNLDNTSPSAGKFNTSKSRSQSLEPFNVTLGRAEKSARSARQPSEPARAESSRKSAKAAAAKGKKLRESDKRDEGQDESDEKKIKKTSDAKAGETAPVDELIELKPAVLDEEATMPVDGETVEGADEAACAEMAGACLANPATPQSTPDAATAEAVEGEEATERPVIGVQTVAQHAAEASPDTEEGDVSGLMPIPAEMEASTSDDAEGEHAAGLFRPKQTGPELGAALEAPAEDEATAVAGEDSAQQGATALPPELLAEQAAMQSNLPDSKAAEALKPGAVPHQVAQCDAPNLMANPITSRPTDPITGPSPTPPTPPAPPDFAAVNHSRIVSAVRGELLPNGGTMQIRLDPPQLGALQVSIHMRDGVMTASFETSNDEATKLLSHSLSRLKTALEAQGVSVEKLQVRQAAPEPNASNNNQDRSNQDQRGPQDHSAQQEQQRKELIRKMWAKLSGRDPLDVTG